MVNDKVVIKKAHISDLENVLDICSICFDNLGRQRLIIADTIYDSIINENAFRYNIYYDDDFVGTGGCFIYDENKSRVSCIAILPEYHGKGLGRVLMQFIEDKVKNDYNKSYIFAEATYNSYGFYNKLGYTVEQVDFSLVFDLYKKQYDSQINSKQINVDNFCNLANIDFISQDVLNEIFTKLLNNQRNQSSFNYYYINNEEWGCILSEYYKTNSEVLVINGIYGNEISSKIKVLKELFSYASRNGIRWLNILLPETDSLYSEFIKNDWESNSLKFNPSHYKVSKIL